MRQNFFRSLRSRLSGGFLLPLVPFVAVLALLSTTGCDSEPEVAEVVVDDVDVEPSTPPESEAMEETTLGEADSDASDSEAMELDSASPANDPAPAEPPQELSIGDQAPQLTLASYVTGQPLESDAGDGVRVVEFWATWCGPCKVSMPHLSKIQEEYGDKVDIVGVTDESVAKVENFLTGDAPNGEPWQDVITYRLATDQGRKTYTAYMQAAGQNGIPTAFIVGRDGIVEWIGHPSTMDEPLAKVVEGNWDRQAAIEAAEQQKALQRAMQELQQMLASNNWDEALGLLNELEEKTGKSIDLTRTRLLVLERAGRNEEAAEVRTLLIDEAWENAPLLNALAWNIAMRGQEENLPSALRAAERAVELKEEADASSLDTLARVHYEMGNLDKAIEWQKKAAEVNQGTYEQIDQVLEKYENEKAEQSKEAEGEDEKANADNESAETSSAESTTDEAESAEPKQSADKADSEETASEESTADKSAAVEEVAEETAADESSDSEE